MMRAGTSDLNLESTQQSCDINNAAGDAGAFLRSPVWHMDVPALTGDLIDVLRHDHRASPVRQRVRVRM
jgi:hypothetical protein